MNYRRWSRICEGAVAACVGLLHVGLFLLAPLDAATPPEERIAIDRWREPISLARGVNPLADLLCDTLPLCQLALLVCWATLGPGRARVRLPLMGIFAGLWSLMWLRSLDFGVPYTATAFNTPEAFALRVGLFALVGVVALRLGGLRVVDVPLANEAGQSQFTLRSLLLTTAAVGVTFGGLEWLRPTLSTHDSFYATSLWADVVEGSLAVPSWPSPRDTRQLVMAAAAAATALAAVWAVARPGGVAFRLALVAVGVPAVGAYLSQAGGAADDQFRIVAINLSTGLAALAVLVAVTMLPLRLTRFRLARSAQRLNPVA